jgi:hypothetical protein
MQPTTIAQLAAMGISVAGGYVFAPNGSKMGIFQLKMGTKILDYCYMHYFPSGFGIRLDDTWDYYVDALNAGRSIGVPCTDYLDGDLFALTENGKFDTIIVSNLDSR